MHRPRLTQASHSPPVRPLLKTQMGLTFDGTYYWSVTGGSARGMRESQYNAAGVLIADYAPNLDFRSIFSAAPDRIFARTYNSNVIYKQTSDGVFAGVTTLQGGLDSQSAVALIKGSSSAELIARLGATVTRWDVTGQLIGTVELIGFGSVPGEDFVSPESWYRRARQLLVHLQQWASVGVDHRRRAAFQCHSERSRLIRQL